MRYGYERGRNKEITAGTVILFVLFAMLDGRGAAKMIWRHAFAYLREKEKEEKRAAGAMGYAAFGVAMSRLKRDGLVESGGWGIWRITKKGKEAAISAQNIKNVSRSVSQVSARDTIVIFDVPEKERKKRTYLRYELLGLGFELLQKSVWIGAGPLPKDFIEYLRKENLLVCVHIFGIRKAGTVSIALNALK